MIPAATWSLGTPYEKKTAYKTVCFLLLLRSCPTSSARASAVGWDGHELPAVAEAATWWKHGYESKRHRYHLILDPSPSRIWRHTSFPWASKTSEKNAAHHGNCQIWKWSPWNFLKNFQTSKHHSLFWRLALSTSLVASRQTLESQNFQLQLDSICPGNSLLGQNPVAQNSRFQVGTWHRSLQGAILDKYVHIWM